MKLTGKAKEKFLEYVLKNYGYDKTAISYCPEIYLNAIIIEFFDSVGLFFSINYEDKVFDTYINTLWVDTNQPTRKQATEKAIERANEIYNDILA